MQRYPENVPHRMPAHLRRHCDGLWDFSGGERVSVPGGAPASPHLVRENGYDFSMASTRDGVDPWTVRGGYGNGRWAQGSYGYYERDTQQFDGPWPRSIALSFTLTAYTYGFWHIAGAWAGPGYQWGLYNVYGQLNLYTVFPDGRYVVNNGLVLPVGGDNVYRTYFVSASMDGIQAGGRSPEFFINGVSYPSTPGGYVGTGTNHRKVSVGAVFPGAASQAICKLNHLAMWRRVLPRTTLLELSMPRRGYELLGRAPALAIRSPGIAGHAYYYRNFITSRSA